MNARYFPEVFDAPDMERARKIILTEEGPGADTATRWALETPYLIELIGQAFALRSDMLVLDYGCGIGRMAKAMIDVSGCSVIGVDISPNMRKMAADYVGSERFLALSPEQFDVLVGAGLRMHAAISVWVLQHCFAPALDIARIGRSLGPDGRGFVLNMTRRAVPALLDDAPPENKFIWAYDNVDVATLLRAAFDVLAEGAPDRSRTPNMGDAGAFWMGLRQRPG